LATGKAADIATFLVVEFFGKQFSAQKEKNLLHKCSEWLRNAQKKGSIFWDFFFQAMFESPDKNGNWRRSVRKSG
jgi:hypothetical protein